MAVCAVSRTPLGLAGSATRKQVSTSTLSSRATRLSGRSLHIAALKPTQKRAAARHPASPATAAASPNVSSLVTETQEGAEEQKPTLRQRVTAVASRIAAVGVLAGVCAVSSMGLPRAASAEGSSSSEHSTAAVRTVERNTAGVPEYSMRSKGPVADIAGKEPPPPAIDAADTAWVLTSTALVLFMTLPGLSMFYAGLVKQKNVLSMFMQCFTIACVMTIMWTVFGYSMSFSTAGMTEGVTTVNSFIGSLDKVMLAGVTDGSIVGTIPESLWFCFQMTFAIITPALMVGAMAERMKFSAVMLFVVLFAITIYFPACHMIWAGPGAYFADMGVLDFAGGIVVHITAAVAALVACIMVGPRKQNEMTPHNLPMTVAGAGMLWVGWYGFNAGSAAAAGAAAAMAMAVTQISAATGALVWSIWDAVELGKPQSLGIATGCIAGLAAITPAAGFVGPVGALCIGAVSAILCRTFSLKIKEALGYDDSLDVFNVHGVGGFTGTILAAVFASPQFGGNQVGMSISTQLGVQTFAAVSTAVYTAIVSFIILKFVGAVCGGLRSSDAEETMGLDSADHDEVAYEK